MNNRELGKRLIEMVGVSMLDQDAEMVAQSFKAVDKATTTFLNATNIGTVGDDDKLAIVGQESIDNATISSLKSAIDQFVCDASIPDCRSEVVRAVVVQNLEKHCGSGNATNLQNSEDFGKVNLAYDAYTNLQNLVGEESFDQEGDKSTIDLRGSINVSVMKLNKCVLSALYPERPVLEPVVQFKTRESLVGDITQPKGELTSLVDLKLNPAPCSIEGKRIQPNLALPEAGKYLHPDGSVRVGVPSNLLELDLEIDDNNSTNTVIEWSDSIDTAGGRLESVSISIAESGAADAAVEIFEFTLPGQRNELTDPHRNLTSERVLVDTFKVVLKKDSMVKAGIPSTILASLASTDYLAIELSVGARVECKSGNQNLMVTASIEPASLDGDASTACVDLCDAAIVTGHGGVYDLKRSPLNRRFGKTMITEQVRPYERAIPKGVHFLHTGEVGKVTPAGVTESLVDLHNIAHDARGITHLRNTITGLAGDIEAYNAGTGDNPGTAYPSVGRVIPHAVDLEFDAAAYVSRQSADIPGDIKEAFKTFLLAALIDLQEKSLIRDAVDGADKLVVRAVCSGAVLGNVIGRPAMHQAFTHNEGYVNGNPDIEYSMELDNKWIFEVRSCTHTIGDNISCSMFAVGNPTSVINTAQNCSMSPVVTTYIRTSSAVERRTDANVREYPITTCPVGINISVKNVDNLLKNNNSASE